MLFASKVVTNILDVFLDFVENSKRKISCADRYDMIDKVWTFDLRHGLCKMQKDVSACN